MSPFVVKEARADVGAPLSLGGATEAKASGGMFTSLILILLTVVVYLFSQTLPDDTRRRAIHASLAKAFLFDARQPARIGATEGPVHLLAPGRQALRELEAGLPAAAGSTGWEATSLVVTLPTDALFAADGHTLADPAGTLPRVARLASATTGDVRVEAMADLGADGDEPRSASLTRAVTVTRALVADEGGRLDPGRLSAVGLGFTDAVADPAAEPDRGGVRVVFVDAKGEL